MRKKALLMSLCGSVVYLTLVLQWISRAEVLAQTMQQNTAVSQAYAKVDNTSAGGLSLQFYTPPATINDAQEIGIAGLEMRTHEIGAPALPYYTTFIALPPEAEVAINLETGPAVSWQPPAALPGNPVPELAYNNDANNPQFPDTPTPGSLAYWADSSGNFNVAWYPTAVYELSEPFYYRDLRLVQLKLYPLRYHLAQNQLEQISEMQVSLSFRDANLDRVQPLPGGNLDFYQALRPSILNFDQALAWRHLPQNIEDFSGPGLPIGINTYKIHVDADGIYEISGAELAAAGMNLSQVNPQTIEMMHRGEPVAYQYVGDPNDGFQPGDAVRFFGRAFTGPRLETQFVSDNVYWLWAEGSPSYITERANDAGQGQPLLSTFRSTITREPEQIHFSTWTNRWDEFPNEPDAWYWDEVRQQTNPVLTRTYAITLPHPALTGANPTYVVEMLSRESSTNPSNLTYNVQATINNFPEKGESVWQGLRNVNLTGSQPITTLVGGVNQVTLVFASSLNARLYLNRISVDYERLLTSDNDELMFNKQNNPGVQQFFVNNFSENDPTQFFVWDVSNPLQPAQISITTDHISGSGPFTVTFTSAEAENGRYIATTSANIRTVKEISQYTPQSLEPAAGADWIALSHSLFLTEAHRLADHRADAQFGGLETYVVDVEDVINQFGYGLPLPESIRHYLGYALVNWPKAPNYVVLVGAGTINPKNLSCYPNPLCRPQWDSNQPNYLLTDIIFVDRFQGAIPSDHTFVTLIGSDLLPDMAIGRLVVNTVEEANNVVLKIIQYDQNQLIPTESQRHFLFAADNSDVAGNFCLENTNVGNNLPSTFLQSHVCLDESTITDTNRLRNDMKYHIVEEGVIALNYRGHGGVQYWASPPIFNVNPTSIPNTYAYQVYITTTTIMTGGFWANLNEPLIIISADCLDGNFAFPGEPALSRIFMTMPNVGTAAHWSSTGLGFTFEHTVLVNALYEGTFDLGQTAIGDAINHAKFFYTSGGYHPSEIYSFLLQGDPAMQLYRPDLSLEKSSPQGDEPLYPGDEAVFHLTVHNQGIFASNIVLTDQLPAGITYQAHSASQPVNLTVDGPNLLFTLAEPLDWGESASITLTTVVTNGVDGLVTNYATVQSAGWDLDLADNEANTSVQIRDTNVRLTKSSPQSNATLYPGDVAVFFLEIRNGGLSSNTITLTDSLPVGLAYQEHSASAPISLTGIISDNLLFSLDNPLAPGESVHLVITTTVTGDAVGVITNTAVARGEGGDEDTASASVLVYYLNLRLEKSSPQSEWPINPLDQAVFHLLVHNEGIKPAENIMLTDTLPAGLQYLGYDASVPVTLTIATPDLFFELADPLLPGESAAFTITTTVQNGFTGLLTNTAVIESPVWTINPANREASASIFVRPYNAYLPIVMKP